jgi:hypothetical protein
MINIKQFDVINQFYPVSDLLFCSEFKRIYCVIGGGGVPFPQLNPPL